MTDHINHPKHYNDNPSGIECIWVTEHMNFCIGNAMKYLWRCGKKGPKVEDLRKSIWYLEREISRIERFETAANHKPPCDPDQEHI